MTAAQLLKVERDWLYGSGVGLAYHAQTRPGFHLQHFVNWVWQPSREQKFKLHKQFQANLGYKTPHLKKIFKQGGGGTRL